MRSAYVLSLSIPFPHSLSFSLSLSHIHVRQLCHHHNRFLFYLLLFFKIKHTPSHTKSLTLSRCLDQLSALFFGGGTRMFGDSDVLDTNFADVRS